ncbi:MAG: hypothetical protein ACLFPU_10970 [Dehalococcoidia bacterium]
MFKANVFVAVLITIALVLVPCAAFAAETPPCAFMGTAYLDGQEASEVTVSAWIDGETKDEWKVITGSGGEYYLQVDGDHERKTVSFEVDGVEAEETATWSQGTTIEIDLNANGTSNDESDSESGDESDSESDGESNGESGGSEIEDVEVETLEPGASATADFDPSTGVLTLGIPQGEKGSEGSEGPEGPEGPEGEPGTGIEDVKVETLEPGASATADFDPSTGVLTLGIPQGEEGPEGPEGPQGPEGEPGTSVEEIEVKTLEPGAEVASDFDSEAGVLTIGIPEGEKGQPGERGETGEQGPEGPQGPGAPGGTALPIIAIVLSALALIVSFLLARRPRV